MHGTRGRRSRRSTVLTALAFSAAFLAVVAWLAAVFTWTAAARVTSPGGFAQVTVETVQSPAGSQAVTGALVDRMVSYATTQGFDLTTSARRQLDAQVARAIRAADVASVMGPAISRAREAYQQAPDGPITIDFASLRPRLVEGAQQVDPALLRAIPPGGELTVTVQKGDLPPLLARLVGASAAFALLPLWLALGAVALGVIGMWATSDRSRMLRWLGVGSLLVAAVPLTMRAAVPPIAASFATAGTQASVVSTAATAIVGNWWIALVVSAATGVALIGASFLVGRGPSRPRGPGVLGG